MSDGRRDGVLLVSSRRNWNLSVSGGGLGDGKHELVLVAREECK